LARRVSTPAAFKTQLGQQNRLNQQGVEQGALAALELAGHRQTKMSLAQAVPTTLRRAIGIGGETFPKPKGRVEDLVQKDREIRRLSITDE